jgi:hypothetical protein
VRSAAFNLAAVTGFQHRRTTLPQHEIYISTLPRLDIQHADLIFEIRSNGELLGYLGISQGTLSWQPKYGPRRHIEWEQLDEISEEWPEW